MVLEHDAGETMTISRIDFWKLTKESFFDSHKGALLTLELISPVLAAIEEAELPLREKAAEPETEEEWRAQDALYDSLYGALGDVHDALSMCKEYCRQNNEMWANYEKLSERYKQLQSRYGERPWWDR